ncbi:MAG: response regulator [Deltaproteobacteria bacterium]|jgi:DNA-binding response OmpR family regulator
MQTAPETTRVLLVEDNPADAALITRYLKDHSPQFEISAARSLAEALSTAHAERADVILLDLGLPDSDGTKTVTAVSQACRQPIVVLTGRISTDDGLECLAAGAHDYLPKSELSSSQLRRAIGYALFRSREERLEDLEAALVRLRAVSRTEDTATSARSGAPSFEERDPESYETFVGRYLALLEEYLDHVTQQRPRPREGIRRLASDLSASYASARDVIDVHLAALERGLEDATPERREVVRVDGRLLGLEVMGSLVDLYRDGSTGRRGRT